ncbi:gag-pol polyprotein [Tanacetum coccineum]
MSILNHRVSVEPLFTNVASRRSYLMVHRVIAIDLDAPSGSHTSSSLDHHSSSVHHGVAGEQYAEVNPFAAADHEPFVNVFAPDDNSEASTSGEINIPESNQSTQPHEHIRMETFSIDNIIGKSIRRYPLEKQLATDALWCFYNSVLSKVEPKNFQSAATEDCWFQAMQDEIHEFDRLVVWELVPPPDSAMIIALKWIYKVKLDEYGDVLKNKARLGTRILQGCRRSNIVHSENRQTHSSYLKNLNFIKSEHVGHSHGGERKQNWIEDISGTPDNNLGPTKAMMAVKRVFRYLQEPSIWVFGIRGHRNGTIPHTADGRIHEVVRTLAEDTSAVSVPWYAKRTRFEFISPRLGMKCIEPEHSKVFRYMFPRSCQSRRDLPRDNPLVSVDVLRSIKARGAGNTLEVHKLKSHIKILGLITFEDQLSLCSSAVTYTFRLYRSETRAGLLGSRCGDIDGGIPGVISITLRPEITKPHSTTGREFPDEGAAIYLLLIHLLIHLGNDANDEDEEDEKRGRSRKEVALSFRRLLLCSATYLLSLFPTEGQTEPVIPPPLY